VVELHAGPTAVLERGRSFALAPVAPGEALREGDRVAFRQMREIGREIARSISPALEVVRSLGRDIGRDR